jgi:hypothetical protein
VACGRPVALSGGESMADLAELGRLVTYCGGFCGSCGMYKGRVIAKVAADLKELIDTHDFAEWVPVYEDIDFSFDDFQRGLEFFSDEERGPYCQHPCKEGGGAPCQIRPCAREKGFDVCFECPEFPCEKLAWVIERHPERLEDHERFKALGWQGWIDFYQARAEKGYARSTGKYYAVATRAE